MKKILATVLALAACAPALAAPYGGIQVTVDGRPVPFDQPPVFEGTRVLVPLRGVFEQLGATVNYQAATRRIEARRGADVVQLELNSRTAFVNGQPRTLDTPATSVGGRAMVPLRFVSEALGANVTWNPSTRLVMVTSANMATRPVTPPAPVAPVQLVQSVVTDTRGPVYIGRDVNVTMYGQPGGRASFDIGSRVGLPMTEGPAGTYKGFYTVRAGDNMQNALVTAHLVLSDRRESAMNAPNPITLVGTEPNHPPANAHPFIRSVTHNVTTPLGLGQTMQINMVGAAGGLCAIDVGARRNLPMTEVSPGTYVGSYTPAIGEVNPQARVVVHIRMPNGQTDTENSRTISVYGIPR